MVKLSFYEQVGILIPGALFIAVLLWIVPDANAFLSRKDISIGEFGIFLIVAYASGHAIAAFGNLMENVWWFLRGGMPSDWVIYDDDRVLSTQQKSALLGKIVSDLDIGIQNIVGTSRKSWSPIFRQIYCYTMSISMGRIESFNGNYGLNRGLAAALFVLAVINQFIQPDNYAGSIFFVCAGVIYGYRMNRFAIHFAREVYLVFLNSRQVASMEA